MAKEPDPWREAQVDQLVRLTPWAGWSRRRRRLTACGLALLWGGVLTGLGLMLWPTGHGATIFAVAVTASICLAFLVALVVAPARLARWLALGVVPRREDLDKAGDHPLTIRSKPLRDRPGLPRVRGVVQRRSTYPGPASGGARATCRVQRQRQLRAPGTVTARATCGNF